MLTQVYLPSAYTMDVWELLRRWRVEWGSKGLERKRSIFLIVCVRELLECVEPRPDGVLCEGCRLSPTLSFFLSLFLFLSLYFIFFLFSFFSFIFLYLSAFFSFFCHHSFFFKQAKANTFLKQGYSFGWLKLVA